MSSTYGEHLKLSIFGQSHAPAIGMTLDGIPAGQAIDLDELQRFLDRRAPGRAEYATPRKEADRPEFLSGLVGNVTCGAPLAAIIRNTNTRSGDYSDLAVVPRPGHADYTAAVKYGGAQDAAGGGHFSGRLTAPLCIAGGICLQLLRHEGIEIISRIAAIAGVEDLGDHYVVHTASGNYESRYLVNCAGVHGHEISAMVGESEWMPKHSRGEYYLLDKSSGDLVNHVIFQCPSVLGKGVLVAPTVHGNLIVGPNAEPVEDGDDRATTQSGLDQVAAFGRKSVPSIDLRQSIRNFSGVRAVTSEEDFIIRPAKNSPRMLYVCGIKSPGLSAAPAIADYALEKLKEMGLAAEKKTMWSGKRTQIRFRKLSDSEKAELVRKDPRYGRIICRCETITEGEIIAAIHSPIPPCSIDGVKRRTGAGMGRCQGGFCGPRVLKILADELGKDPMEIVQDGSATWLLMEETKGGSGK